MKNTSSRYADFIKETNRAALHIPVDGKWIAKLTRDADAQSPGGGVSSNARDMAQWMRLQLANGKYNGKQLINEDALAQTHLPIIIRGPSLMTGKTTFYGLGWNLDYDSGGRLVWGHAGAFSVGGRTVVSLIPSEQVGIVVLSNAFPTGIPEAISDTFFDLIHYDKPQKDYLNIWNNIFDSLFGPVVAESKAKYSKPPAQSSPPLPLPGYAGAYANDYLGNVYVVSEGAGLVLQLGPKKMSVPLKHWDRDVFLYRPWEEAPDLAFTVTFTVGTDGSATQVIIEDLNTDGQGILQRVEEE